MSPAVKKAMTERKSAKGERKSSLTRQVIRLLEDEMAGKTDDTAAPKGAKPVQTAEDRRQIRLDRYMKDGPKGGAWNDGFWLGKASAAQLRRLANDYGCTMPADTIAWQAGEKLAEIKAKQAGLPFVGLVAKKA